MRTPPIPAFPAAPEEPILCVFEAQPAPRACPRDVLHFRSPGRKALRPCVEYYYRQLQALPRRVRRALTRRYARSLAGVALLLALGQLPALAATIAIDGTSCTLVDAIKSANTDVVSGGCPAGNGADTLVLVAGSTHTLTTVEDTTYGGTGLPLVTSQMTIAGNGSAIERGAGAPEFRIMAVGDTGNLALQALTVSGGHTFFVEGVNYSESGGSVFNTGTLTLTDSTVSGSTADSSGGGVFNGYRATLTLTDSTVSGNTAGDDGGGVSNGYRATLTNSTVSDNSAAYSGGGAFNNEDGTLTLTNSTISANSARLEGGGVYNRSGTLAIENSSVSGNSADFRGGGVFNGYSGTLTLTNTTVSGNTADVGGGVTNDGDILTVTNSTVVGNTNGGVFNLGRNLVLITNSTVSYNTTDFRGGGVNNFGALVIENSTVSGNSAAYRGGGVYNFGTLTLTNSTVAGNTTGDRGGGVYNQLFSTLTLARSLISGNTGANGSEAYNYTPYGGGIVHADNFNLFGVNGDAGVVGFTPGPTDTRPGDRGDARRYS